MLGNKQKLFNDILNNFLERFSEIDAIIISDLEGFVIAGEKRKDIDSNIEIISVLTTLINPVLERIRNEFSFKKFGTASFDTDEHRLLFITIDEERILSLIFNSMASVEKVAPYTYFLAEKTAQILNMQGDELVQLDIPDFDSEAERHEKLKESICQSELDECANYAFKFIIVGSHEVGKTSLIRQFVEKKFSHDYRATIGLNIFAHNFDFQGNEIHVQLWDIGAQQYFKRFRKIYYSGAEAAFIVFDITNRESFNKIKGWHGEINQLIDEKNIPIVIVGNKVDLSEQRVISTVEGEELAKLLSETYIETSALSGENVIDAFELIAYHYIIKSKKKEKDVIREDLVKAILSTLKELVILELTFISENMSWDPGFQTVIHLEDLGEYSKLKDSNEEKLYPYKNGLILNSFTYDDFNLSNSDGVFCMFDAREREHIDPKWKDILINIIKKVRRKRAVIVGIRVSDDKNWSQLMEEFLIDRDLEEKVVSVLFLKIGPDYRETIYEHLKLMLDVIVTTRKL
ncbi:MAG TPA: Rab family GTPase [Candidatus Nanopelagicaceae bacterium]|nr:Rab family GTPase [Candidatus Nanopelagicaceae bacterium]